MPCVSEFFGIAIYMYYNDHNPPHFHAEYAGQEAKFTISTLEVLRGELPRRARALVLEWAAFNRGALFENWERARRGESLEMIDPLD